MDFIVHSEYKIFLTKTDPDCLTEFLNIKPSKAWRKGDLYKGKFRDTESGKICERPRNRHNSLWELSSKGVIITDQIGDHIDYILLKIEPCSDKICQLLNQHEEYHIRMCLWLETPYGHMNITINNSILDRASKLCHEFYMAFISTEEEN